MNTPQSYHLLAAALDGATEPPGGLFAWSVRSAVRGLVAHADYLRRSQRARRLRRGDRPLEARLRELARLDANPMARLVRPARDDAAFRLGWNRYNRLAPLGVDTQLQAPGPALQRQARAGIADDGFRRDTVAACIAALRDAAAQALPSSLAESARSLGDAAGDTLAEALALLRQQPEADLVASAAALGCRPRTLQRRFTQAGLSFNLLRQATRIELAGELLRQPAPPSLTEVAQAAGFFDSAHFGHAWRQSCGLAPGDYRDIATAMRAATP
ncbi:helix-turn-helix domain-containing protein [Pelomonas sp. CA6]|uniref:AraC family transcriptional regulator n=1 Tax=Pelomonas sp. CA6 TaxID=2907999 RepID=UPI001F4BF32B|nr:helix-turn-helix domain-containing protein [Pelomonas sp. CA6]MCH7343153.1 helix-turn-helix domain-containing protein [Pelomonas sp. CA6]